MARLGYQHDRAAHYVDQGNFLGCWTLYTAQASDALYHAALLVDGAVENAVVWLPTFPDLLAYMAHYGEVGQRDYEREDWAVVARRAAGAVAILEAPPTHGANGHASPGPAPPPLLTQLAQERTQLQRALEAVQQRVEQNARARHAAQWRGRTALERLRQASRVARACDAHAVQAAFARVQGAAEALAVVGGAEEAARAASDLAYVPRGL